MKRTIGTRITILCIVLLFATFVCPALFNTAQAQSWETYTISVVNAQQQPMEGIIVFFHSWDPFGLEWVEFEGETNANGIATQDYWMWATKCDHWFGEAFGNEQQVDLPLLLCVIVDL